jgi:hypothetical protein
LVITQIIRGNIFFKALEIFQQKKLSKINLNTIVIFWEVREQLDFMRAIYQKKLTAVIFIITATSTNRLGVSMKN